MEFEREIRESEIIMELNPYDVHAADPYDFGENLFMSTPEKTSNGEDCLPSMEDVLFA